MATSLRWIGTPLRLATTTFSRSPSPWSQPTPRIRYSRVAGVEHLAADALVAVGDRAVETAQRQVIRPELVRINLHLVLPDKPADAGHLRHARDAVELVANGPVLDRPQLIQTLALAFDGIPEDLPEGGGVRRQVGRDPGRQGSRGDLQPLQHAGAGKVEVRLLIEDDVDHREVELAR